MDRKIFIETMLRSKRYLEKLCAYLDGEFGIKAMSGCYNSLSRVYKSPTLRNFNELVFLINRKIKKINLNILTEKSIQYLSPKLREFVDCFYIQRLTFDKTAQELKVSIRTALRWRSVVIDEIDNALNRIRFTDKELINLVDGEDWFWQIYTQCKKDSETNHATKLYYSKILKSEQKSINKHISLDFDILDCYI